MTKARIVIFSKLPQIPGAFDNQYIRGHIDSIKAPVYKAMSAYSYYLLGQMIDEVFGDDISKLKINENDNGKPYFERSNIYFNISHTDDAVACIVSDNIVGIDIEKIKNYNERLLKYSMNEEEIINNEEDFFKFWTLKEAYVKATGTGLSHGFKNIKFINTDSLHSEIKCVDNNKPAPYFFYTNNSHTHIFSICSRDRINNDDITILYK